MTFSIDSLISAATAGGGMSVIMALIGRYFITKTFKQFEQMSNDIRDMKLKMDLLKLDDMGRDLAHIKTQMAVYDAIRAKEEHVIQTVDRMKIDLVTTSNRVDAIFRILDGQKTKHINSG